MMAGEAIWQVGVAPITGDFLRTTAIAGGSVAVFFGAQRIRWHLTDWRIARARAAGNSVRMEELSWNHDEEPRSLGSIAAICAGALIGLPLLQIFIQNFAGELEALFGPGYALPAGMFAVGFVSLCQWMWQRWRRELMSPEELEALEEREEEERFVRDLMGDNTPGIIFALLGGAAIFFAIFTLIQAITPL